MALEIANQNNCAYLIAHGYNAHEVHEATPWAIQQYVMLGYKLDLLLPLGWTWRMGPKRTKEQVLALFSEPSFRPGTSPELEWRIGILINLGLDNKTWLQDQEKEYICMLHHHIFRMNDDLDQIRFYKSEPVIIQEETKQMPLLEHLQIQDEGNPEEPGTCGARCTCRARCTNGAPTMMHPP